MKISAERDIWSFLPTHHIVIPTNIGWRSDGSAVMGAGLAKQAAERFPGVAKWWGVTCRMLRHETSVQDDPASNLVLLPVKPLDEKNPHLSWQQPASLELIERSLRQLVKMDLGDVAVPLLGCGNGGLEARVVLPLMRELLDDRFLLVDWQLDGVAALEGGPEGRATTTEDP